MRKTSQPVVDTSALVLETLLAQVRGEPLPRFAGYPYLMTRVVDALYHFIVLPAWPSDKLSDLADAQVRANQLYTCLVFGRHPCIYFGAEGSSARATFTPCGGIPIAGRLLPPIPLPETPDLRARREDLKRFVEQHKREGYLVANHRPLLRHATDDELRTLRGRQANGVPLGLNPCARCGEWRGECLDPSPEYADRIVRAYCVCENHNVCARCGLPLAARRLNACYYSEREGLIWHVPGFSGLGHQCPTVN